MQAVVAAYVVHARRYSIGTPIDESGRELRMTLRSLAFNADLPLSRVFNNIVVGGRMDDMVIMYAMYTMTQRPHLNFYPFPLTTIEGPMTLRIELNYDALFPYPIAL